MLSSSTTVFRSVLRTPFVLLAALAAPGMLRAQTQGETTQPPAPIVRAPRTPQSAPGTHRPVPRLDTGTAIPRTAIPGAVKGTGPLRAVPPATSVPAAATQREGSPSNLPAKTQSHVAPPAPAEHKASTNGLNRDTIVIDPGHGGADSGARIGDTTLEKNVTLQLAFRLRSLLLARGFTVVLTRDSDAATFQSSPAAAPAPLTLDDRAGIANHSRAAACLLLHATSRGNGLHLYSTEMEPSFAEPALVPWLIGQAAWVPASRALEAQLSTALGRSHIPMLASAASVRPVDSLTCPAVVLELAPENSDVASINDAGYQERVAAALANSLVFWGKSVQAPPRLPAPIRVHSTPHSLIPMEENTARPAEPATPETQP